MSLFGVPRWLRNFIRKRTKPIPEDRAIKTKQKLSIAYAILAWNAFGYVLYCIYNGKADWALYHGYKSPEEAAMPAGWAWAKTLNIRKATVYKLDGTHVSKYEIDQDLEDQKQKTRENISKEAQETL